MEDTARDRERFARPIDELQAEFTQRFHAFVTGAAALRVIWRVLC